MQIKSVLINEEVENTNYNKLKKQNINYVILRAGYTTYDVSKLKKVDKMFEYNYKKALNNNMLISSYYESCAITKKEAIEEAELFYNLIKNKELSGPIFILIKDDHSTIIYSNKSQKTIQNKELINIIKTFCDKMNEYGYEVALISYKNWFDNIINDEQILEYDKVILSDNYEQESLNNIVYLCKSTIYNKCNKNDKIDVVVNKRNLKDKIKNLFKFIRGKISSIFN